MATPAFISLCTAGPPAIGEPVRHPDQILPAGDAGQVIGDLLELLVK